MPFSFSILGSQLTAALLLIVIIVQAAKSIANLRKK